MVNELKSQILKDVLKAVEDIYAFYLSAQQYSFWEIENIYEKIVYIMSNNNLVKSFDSCFLKTDGGGIGGKIRTII